MILFAVDFDTILKIAVPLIMVGIWIINQIAGKGEEQGDVPRPRAQPRRPPAQPPAPPEDIDQFLDEVLNRPGGGRAAPAGRPGEVVVLRPPGAPARPRPEPRRARPVRPPRTPLAKPISAAPEAFEPKASVLAQVQAEVNRAAAAPTAAAAAAAASLRTTAQAVDPSRLSYPLAELAAHVRSPADIRRAIVLREVLGPPRAFRPIRSSRPSII